MPAGSRRAIALRRASTSRSAIVLESIESPTIRFERAWRVMYQDTADASCIRTLVTLNRLRPDG